MSTHPDLAAVLARIDADFPATVERLKQLVRIPSCSFPGFDPKHLIASAEATAAWLRDVGYPEVKLVGCGDAPPYVIAKDHRAGPNAPTLLLYAHHDVQPPLRQDVWQSPPFDPVERDGRLYGRGAADDKAGIVLHAAAAAAWNAVAGKPPVNLTVVIEGEEEVNSPHFSRFLATHRAELAADCLIIADLVNLDTGLPTLTTSLRGLVAVEVELRALTKPLHSGMWGGVVPDPALALCRLLARLSDDHGRIAIPGVYDAVRPLSDADRAELARVPYDSMLFAAQAGLVKPEHATPDGVTHHARLWREPALGVNAIQSGTRGQTGNVVMDAAWARVGIRIVPDQRAEDILAKLTAFLHRHAPAHMELSVKPVANGEAWATRSDHPAFAAARRALECGYGVTPVEAGCGASVPFVGEMSAALGGVPALLLGVEDPICAAHAENESVPLDDLRKAVRAEAALFAFIGQ
jgi:acetylornithine deacetylase/succinyl-diaminopimelate desuccinylase-like protein